MSDPKGLPAVKSGHWSTPDGHEMALHYGCKSRRDLCMGDLSDFELANAQFLVDRRALELIHFQTAAKDRIRWLSVQLALALSIIEALEEP